jgi:transcriptional regulator with XRE-family HTH domain
MEEIVTRIENWLQKRGMTPAELAKELGMNRSSVVHMLSGRNKPSLKFILNIARYDDQLDLRELLTGSSIQKTIKVDKHVSIKEIDTTPPQHSTVIETKEVVREIVKERLIVLKNDGTFDSFTKEG